LLKSEETKTNFEYTTTKENVKQQENKRMRKKWNRDQWIVGSVQPKLQTMFRSF